jgi:DNA-binding GntR family transcriptional regulator
MAEPGSTEPSADGQPVDDPSQQDFRTLSEYVREVLRRRILSGWIAPGTRLVERQVGEDLGVSRVPVREAIRALAEEGLVEIRGHGRGAIVRHDTEEALHQFLEVRLGLEYWATILATERAGRQQISRLRQLIEAGLDAIKKEDFERSRELGRTWHRALAECSGNQELVRHLALLDDRIAWGTKVTLAARGVATWLEHGEILEAIEQGQARLAADLLRSHMQLHERLQVVRFVPDHGPAPSDGS